MSDRPHAGRHRLTVLRKMIMAAIEEEWIESDPTYKLKYRPETIAGFRAWTEDEMAAFEERWPIGTTPRLVYEMGLWLGARRCDIARLRPQDIKGDLMVWTQQKTNSIVTVPITKWVAEAFAATDMAGPTIVMTEYGLPFSAKSLTGRMRDWSGAAGLKGCTLHGLRKTLGKRVTDAKGTTRQAMAVLGHETMEQAELYSRAADREDLARDALDKVVSMVEKRRAKKAG
jgi:integrase